MAGEERRRLATDRLAWRRWGPYLVRARLGHRPRGLQRRRRRLGLLPARPRPLARLPLERGRPRPASATTGQTLCFALRVLERPRPDPQGAHLRPDRPRGQPRRGRQGVLVVPRLDADPLVDALALPLPAGRVPVRASWSPRTAAAAGTTPSSSCSTPASSTTTATGTITVDYAKAAPDDIVHPRRGPQRRPGRRRRCTCCRRSGSATRGRGATDDRRPSIAAEDGALVAEHHDLGTHGPRRRAGAPRAAVLRQRDERRAAVGRRRPRRRTRRTASTTTSCTAPRRSTPSGPARRPRSATGSTVAAGRDGRDRGCGSAPERAAVGDDVRRRRWPRAEREADEFYAALTPAGATADEALVLRQALAGMLWRSSSTTTTSSAGSTATRPARRRRPSAPARPQRRAGAHLNNADVISMPDTWEYPWYAAWDLAFHCVALAHVDPEFAKEQLLLLLPRVVHAPQRPAARVRVGVRRRQPAGARWAALRVFEIDGGQRLRLPRADLPQAAAQLHVVGEPQGRRRQQRVRGRLPRPRQHRPVRPLGAAARRRPRSSSPTARRGWRCTA